MLRCHRSPHRGWVGHDLAGGGTGFSLSPALALAIAGIGNG